MSLSYRASVMKSIRLALSTHGLTKVGLSLGALLLGNGTGAFAHDSPRQVNRTVFASAFKTGFFHYTNTYTANNDGTILHEQNVGEIGPDEGLQFDTGDLGSIEIIVIQSTAYVKADPTGLQFQLGYSPKVASMYANKWISLTPKDSPYSYVVDLVTLSSFWGHPTSNAELSISDAPQKVTPVTKHDGRSVQSIVYSIHDIFKNTSSSFIGTSRLYFPSASPYLPYLSVTETNGKLAGTKASSKGSITFSKWGQQFQLTAPVGALVFSSLPKPSNPV
jgi:hypothetical protein